MPDDAPGKEYARIHRMVEKHGQAVGKYGMDGAWIQLKTGEGFKTLFCIDVEFSVLFDNFVVVVQNRQDIRRTDIGHLEIRCIFTRGDPTHPRPFYSRCTDGPALRTFYPPQWRLLHRIQGFGVMEADNGPVSIIQAVYAVDECGGSRLVVENEKFSRAAPPVLILLYIHYMSKAIGYDHAAQRGWKPGKIQSPLFTDVDGDGVRQHLVPMTREREGLDAQFQPPQLLDSPPIKPCKAAVPEQVAITGFLSETRNSSPVFLFIQFNSICRLFNEWARGDQNF